MEFRILGEVEVRDGERRLELHGRRERALLAYLLLHANQVVPSDRLIVELWGDSPPPTVSAALHVYISRLRKLLGDNGSAIVTRSPGYVLEVDPEHIDARRFERLVETGRRALADGDPATAAQRLRDALALWHGTPLANVSEPEWAENEIRRLREVHLTALEDRIEADLQLGHHAHVVSELEGLVACHPLRERLRTQLMLALYRCDRQGDALQVYTDTRRVLAEELGIDPSGSLRRLEQAILAQDRALDSPRTAPTPARPTPRRRRLTFVLVPLSIAGLAVAAIAVFTGGGGGVVTVVPNSVAVIDPTHNRVIKDIRLGGAPAALAAGAGAVWVADHDDGTVVRIDADDQSTRAIAVGIQPRSVAVNANSIWVTDGRRLVRIDGRYGRVNSTTALHQKTPGVGPQDITSGSPGVVASGPAGLWTAHSVSAVSRIDPSTTKVIRSLTLEDVPLGLAVADDAVWVASPPTNRLTAIDAATASVTGTVRVPGLSYGGEGVGVTSWLAVDRSSVWVPTTDSVTRIDPLTLGTIKKIPTGAGALGIAFGSGSVWVSNYVAGTVSRIDPKTNKVIATIRVGKSPASVAVTRDRIWVTVT